MHISWRSTALAAGVLAGYITAATAADPLPVDKVISEPRIRMDGPYLFVGDGTKLVVTNAEELKYLGSMGGVPSWRGNLIVPPGGDTIWLTNSYYSHGVPMVRDDVVEQWNINTLSPTGLEIKVPPRLSMRGSDRTMATLSSDGKWMFLQNATPATSVSVVDLSTNKFLYEIPLPGCFGVYAQIKDPKKFVSFCGDGQLVTVTIDARGRNTLVERSSAIFNADVDPVFVAAERDGDTLYTVSYNGDVYKIDISGATATLVDKYSINAGVKGGWKPGGLQLLAYAPEARVLFVLMRPNSKDGDHVEPSSEVWSVDVTSKKVLSRSTVSNATGVAYGALPTPALYMNDREGKTLVRYALDPSAAYTVRFDKKIGVAANHRLQVR
ncbi:MAG: amine dehydrogenase large subunit [Steroidobacteraceae bacterium]